MSAREADDLQRQADDERRQAQQLRQGHSADHSDEDRRQRDHDASKADDRAMELEGRAGALKHESGVGEKEEAENNPERRAWKMVGSVSPDKMQQMEEAGQSQSLMGALAAYGARSLVSRDGNAYQAGKAVAGKLVGRSGKDQQKTGGTHGVMDEVRAHKEGKKPERQQQQKQPERQRQQSRGRER